MKQQILTTAIQPSNITIPPWALLQALPGNGGGGGGPPKGGGGAGGGGGGMSAFSGSNNEVFMPSLFGLFYKAKFSSVKCRFLLIDIFPLFPQYVGLFQMCFLTITFSNSVCNSVARN